MRSLRSLLCFAALAVGATACSLALDFDPEGQPCDERGQCLAGYTCRQGYCEASDSTDGGTSTDAGTRTDGGTLPDGGTGGQGLCADGQDCSAPAEPR